MAVGILRSAVIAGVLLAGAPSAHAQLFFPSWGHDAPPADGYGEDYLPPRAVIRSLYRRYGMARVLDLRSAGDVYQVNAIDRRGQRVLLTVDAYTGELLERRFARYEGEPDLVPPRAIPGGPRGRVLPDEREALPRSGSPGEPGLATPGGEAPAVRAPRQARNPEPGASPVERTKPRSNTIPAPKPTPVIPAPLPAPEPGSATAARPPVPEVSPAPPAAAPVAPPAAPQVREQDDELPPGESGPATAARPEPSTPSTRPPEAKPVAPPPPPVTEPAPQPRVSRPAPSRLPEPLIDPKTGKPNPAAGETPPVTPLDDAGKPADKPIQIVPPATFD